MVIVKVAQGKLRGSEEYLQSGDKYFSFKGIPFAQPPIGELRFKDPQPPKPWDGIKDALQHGPRCPQYSPLLADLSSQPETNEDCLYLNVYTRSINHHGKIPVMLWIHGGAFKIGSGDDDLYGPQYLLEHDVVLVTINYRIEAFGFLCLDTADVPGNAGMKDQVEAMRWVKQNIENFGGDPNDVTIFGESAGGASVALQLLSPLSRGLFTKAIVQSGSAISDWSHIENGREIAFKLGKALGKDTKDPKELLEFLQSLPTDDLVNSTEKVMGTNAIMDIIFLPVVEKDNLGVPGFLYKEPIEYLKSGEVADVPVIIGVTSGEGILSLPEDINRFDLLNEKPDVFVTRELRAGRSAEEVMKIGRLLKEHYLQGSHISEDTVPQLVDLRSDQTFVYPIYRMARLLAANNSSPVYFYYFHYLGELNFMDVIFKGNYAEKLPLTAHGGDLAYMFSSIIWPSPDPKSPSADFIKIFTSFWTNFATKGSPTPDNKLGVKWDRFSTELKNYLIISDPLVVGKNFLADRMKMWDELYEKYGLPLTF